MKPQVALIVFLMLVVTSVAAGFHGYNVAAERIEQDMSRALSRAIAQQQTDRITPDTLRIFRQNITIEAVRSCAYIAMRPRRHDGGQLGMQIVGQADAPVATVYAVSDQRLSLLLMLSAMLWMMAFVVKARRPQAEALPAVAEGHIVLGGLCYAPQERMFYSESHERVHLTPMQQRLMEMFFEAKGNRLSKQEICDTLWPKKPDANETLYTLIRRLKTVVEAHSRLKIESDRGRAYELTIS